MSQIELLEKSYEFPCIDCHFFQQRIPSFLDHLMFNSNSITLAELTAIAVKHSQRECYLEFQQSLRQGDSPPKELCQLFISSDIDSIVRVGGRLCYSTVAF